MAGEGLKQSKTKEKADTSLFRHTKERKAQYVASEQYIREAVVRRGLDNCYRVEPKKVADATKAINVSRLAVGKGPVALKKEFQFEGALELGKTGADFAGGVSSVASGFHEAMDNTNKMGQTGMVGGGIAATLGVVDTGVAIYNMYKHPTVANAIEIGKGLGNTAGGTLDTVKGAMDAFTDSGASDALGAAAAGVGIAMAGIDAAFNVKDMAKGSMVVHGARNLKDAVASAGQPYDLNNPRKAFDQLTAEQNSAVRLVEERKELLEATEKDSTLKGADRDKKITTKKAMVTFAENREKSLLDASTQFAKGWVEMNKLNIVHARAGADVAKATIDLAANGLSIAAGICDIAGAAGGVGAIVGAVLSLGALALKLTSFIVEKVADKKIIDSTVNQEIEGKGAIQSAALHQEGVGVQGDHEGTHSDSMMKLDNLDTIIDDIMDEVYTKLANNSSYDKQTNVTHEKDETEKLGKKKGHGRMTTKAYTQMILFEMGAVSGEKEDIANNIIANRAIRDIIQADKERTAGDVYNKYRNNDFKYYAAKNRMGKMAKAFSRVVPDTNYQGYGENVEPTVQSMEKLRAKKKDVLPKDANKSNPGEIYELPKLANLTATYGIRGINVEELAKSEFQNPFIEQWKKDLGRPAVAATSSAEAEAGYENIRTQITADKDKTDGTPAEKERRKRAYAQMQAGRNAAKVMNNELELKRLKDLTH